MIQNQKSRNMILWLAIVTIGLAFLIGCGGSSYKKTGSQASVRGVTGPSPRYYDFGDVLIPKELKVKYKSSFVYTTSGNSAGVLVLKGRVDVNSLVNFFEANMNKDNWQIVSSFKSPRTILLFQKENRWCVINITEKTISTLVEIWVSPSLKEGQSGLLKG